MRLKRRVTKRERRVEVDASLEQASKIDCTVGLRRRWNRFLRQAVLDIRPYQTVGEGEYCWMMKGRKEHEMKR